jgi:hypothetical protein
MSVVDVLLINASSITNDDFMLLLKNYYRFHEKSAQESFNLADADFITPIGSLNRRAKVTVV